MVSGKGLCFRVRVMPSVTGPGTPQLFTALNLKCTTVENWTPSKENQNRGGRTSNDCQKPLRSSLNWVATFKARPVSSIGKTQNIVVFPWCTCTELTRTLGGVSKEWNM